MFLLQLVLGLVMSFVGAHGCECPDPFIKREAQLECKAVKDTYGREAYRACIERMRQCAADNRARR